MSKSLFDASSDVNYQLAELLRVEELQRILKVVECHVYDQVKGFLHHGVKDLAINPT